MKMLAKVKNAVRHAAMGSLDGWRIRQAQRNQKDVLVDGKWLRMRIQMNRELRRAFPKRIQNTDLKAWNVRPVETWKREQQLERLIDEYQFQFDAMLIVCNPYELTPLSALLIFHTEKKCSVRYMVRGKTTDCDFIYTTSGFETRHRVPVFGLYAACENQVDIELLGEDGEVIAKKQVQIPTESIPDKFGEMVKPVVKGENTAMPFVFVTGGYRSSTYAFDHNGDVRYLLSKIPRQYGVYPLPDGRFLFMDRNINRPTYNNPHAVVMYDMDHLGRVSETYYVEEGIHHWAEAVPGTNGKRILAATSSLAEQLMEGTLLCFDRENGKVDGMYNLGDFFPKELQDKYDWAHLNRIYCQDERHVIVSLRNVHTVAKIDMVEQKVIWILAHPEIYEGTELVDRVLKPQGENFHYFLQQHAVQVVDTGLTDRDAGVIEVTLFDNHCHTKRQVTWFDEKTESYACFYRIDEKNLTVGTTKVIPCALSPTRSNVWFDPEKRKVFGMAGAACSAEEMDNALIYEWDFDTAQEVNRYEISDGFFKAYPFEIRDKGLEKCLEVPADYRKGHLRQPVRRERSVDGAKYLDSQMQQEMAFCYMDDLICIRAKDHKVEKVYFQGDSTWETDFTDTVQKTKVFADKIYYVAVTTEPLPDGEYRLLIRYDGELYDAGKHFAIVNRSDGTTRM